jgi:hypothetical protein
LVGKGGEKVTQPGDTLVLFLLIGVILYFIGKQIPFWPRKNDGQDGEPLRIKGEVPDLLRSHGYEVVRAKEKVPLEIDVDEETYESRLYIDYVARRDEQWYIVIVARERKPLRMSGAGLRDFFLPYYLLYQPDGILYVNKEKQTVKLVQFDVPDVAFQKSQAKWPFYIAAAAFIMLAIWLIR